jgi:alkaline phosphatase
MIARLIPGQKFDLQATIRPDTVSVAAIDTASIQFSVDGLPVSTGVFATQTAGLTGVPAGTVVASVRGYYNLTPGVHTLTVSASDVNAASVTATGNFEVVGVTQFGRKVRNVVIMLGDGMGASQRTAARIVTGGYTQGKATTKLNMDTFPNTAMIMTASLDTIITDSAPGMANYVNGNKAASGQEGVWPDDTTDPFDNPRVEYLSEYLHRTQGKTLGLVTTADVFDATPAANAVHTSNRGAGAGIVDQYLDDAGLTGLTVLMGGGRKWFLPNTTSTGTGVATDTCVNNNALQTCLLTNASAVYNGSARTSSSDYAMLPEIQAAWGAAPGVKDPARNLIQDFQNAGWTYAPDATTLNGVAAAQGTKLLGLFSLSNMNVAYDKINGRRGLGAVVNDFGFPDQPLLEEMTSKALSVLDANSPNGFVLMVEGASIDKQAHLMDTARWITDTIEFDKAVGVAKTYAATHADTLVIVTADHECSGAVIIGASKVTNAQLDTAIATFGANASSNGALNGSVVSPAATATGFNGPALRDVVVGNYNNAKFPAYTFGSDGYPTTMDPDFKLLIGYGANGDRYETWKARTQPTNDTQQPAVSVLPLAGYPRNNYYDGGSGGTRPFQLSTGFLITGQVAGDQAVHTGGDIPLSAYGRGAGLFAGTLDNTDVFFLLSQATIGGTTK